MKSEASSPLKLGSSVVASGSASARIVSAKGGCSSCLARRSIALLRSVCPSRGLNSCGSTGVRDWRPSKSGALRAGGVAVPVELVGEERDGWSKSMPFVANSFKVERANISASGVVEKSSLSSASPSNGALEVTMLTPALHK